MSYNYSQYASDDNNQTTSGSDSGSGSGGSDDLNLTVVPHATIEGDLTKVFGNENQWGQSLGLVWEDVELVDGCLYHDPKKDKHKVFSWKEVVGISPEEEDDPSVFTANDYLVKSYGTTEKRYELVEAVVPGEDEPVEIGDAVVWYSGSEKHGPKSASKTLAKILTRFGRDAVVDPDDINGWLSDVSADNILRADLDGRRFAYFEVKKQSNQSDHQYYHPIVVDVETGAQVTVQNATDDTSDDNEAESGENDADSGTADAPEPIADFMATCDSLGFTDRDRAATLLGDLIADEGNDLTADMVDDFGGEDAVLDEVAE